METTGMVDGISTIWLRQNCMGSYPNRIYCLKN